MTGRFTRPARTSLAGAEIVGTHVATAPPGRSGIYQMTGAVAGTANSLRLWVDASSRASRLVLGLYSDASNNPGTLLGSGTRRAARRGRLEHGVPAGRRADRPGPLVLAVGAQPADSTGTLAWSDRAGTAAARDRARRPERVPVDLGDRAGAAGTSTATCPAARGRTRHRWSSRPRRPTPTPTATPTETVTPTPTATVGPCRSDSCDFEFEPVPQPAMTPTPTPDAVGRRSHRARSRSSWARGARR